jgi:hypothetical protein
LGIRGLEINAARRTGAGESAKIMMSGAGRWVQVQVECDERERESVRVQEKRRRQSSCGASRPAGQVWMPSDTWQNCSRARHVYQPRNLHIRLPCPQLLLSRADVEGEGDVRTGSLALCSATPGRRVRQGQPVRSVYVLGSFRANTASTGRIFYFESTPGEQNQLRSTKPATVSPVILRVLVQWLHA